jgi:tRNA dimethylallyltransferase
MFEDGWIDEVKQIYIKDNNIENLNALKAIGYPQIISSIKNNTKIDIDEIKTKTRQYAKKQRTWMNHHVYDNTLIYKNNYQEVLDKTKQFIDETNS